MVASSIRMIYVHFQGVDSWLEAQQCWWYNYLVSLQVLTSDNGVQLYLSDAYFLNGTRR